MKGLDYLMEKYDTHEGLLAKLVSEVAELNSGKRQITFYLKRAAEAFSLGLRPKKQKKPASEDVMQCFYFIYAIAAIKGYTPDAEPLDTFRRKFKIPFDKENKRVVIRGGEQLRDATQFHSYIALLKAAGMWNTSKYEWKTSLENMYYGLNSKGCIKDFKYKDHSLIEKVLGPGHSTQGA